MSAIREIYIHLALTNFRSSFIATHVVPLWCRVFGILSNFKQEFMLNAVIDISFYSPDV